MWYLYLDESGDLGFYIYAITLNKRRLYPYLVRNKARIYNFIARNVLDQIPFEEADLRIELILDKTKNKREILDFNSYIGR